MARVATGGDSLWALLPLARWTAGVTAPPPSPYPRFIPDTGLRFVEASKASALRMAAYLLDVVMSAWPGICCR